LNYDQNEDAEGEDGDGYPELNIRSDGSDARMIHLDS
jgi:hypothetical protein